jgi:YNFM family putative membrane transporter
MLPSIDAMSTPSSALPLAPATGAAPAMAALPPPFAAGSREHRAARWALFVGGFATFAMFHGPQPLLSLFAQAFALTPAQASGMLSATAGAMALGLIPAGLLAQRFGPKPVMVASIALGAICCLLCAVAPDYATLLALRALLGLALAGLPAVSSAYLAEELEPGALGQAIGLVIAGNAAGGMSSRLVCGVLADLVSWRVALAGLGVLGVLAALEFRRALPPARRFHPRPFDAARCRAEFAHVLGQPGLVPLFLLALLLMGAFMSLYNYLGFRLVAAPFGLSHAGVGAIFLLYIVGMLSSPWAGRQADRLGSSSVLARMLGLMALGIALTAVDHLPAIIAGVAVFTFGFFGAHSVATAWVGRLAGRAKSLSAAIYLTLYYIGASSMGWLGGHAWAAGQWHGMLVFLGGLWLACALAALRLLAIRGTPAAATPAHLRSPPPGAAG